MPRVNSSSSLTELSRTLAQCTLCPRLRKHCKDIAQTKRKSYQSETYWGKPVSGFGDPKAQVLIVGLAPAAHGANRTGRIFTGDRSGDWLYRALYKAGFANQSTSTHANDGLELSNCYVTCAVRCAPPDNRPTPAEIHQCAPYLDLELQLLKNVRVSIALGQIAFHSIWLKLSDPQQKRPKFGHGQVIDLSQGKKLILSYHPSQQNTFTGRLTESMFDSVFDQARSFLN